MTFVLARETGWPESFILWQLPLLRALEYYHAALWSSGAWTVRQGISAQEQARQLSQLVDEISNNEDEADDCF